ncbi:MAG: Gfo/Idh/MocA family protein [Acidimicrobiia bacterium]
MGKPVVAVIGAGAMGSQHARVIAGCDDAVLGVVVDADPERAAAAAARFGCKGATHHASALLCDAAVVATSTDHHVDIAIDLINAQIPVLIEKPLAADIEHCRQILAAAQAKSVPVTCGFVERHNPAVRTAIEQIDGPVRHLIALRHSPPAGRPMSTVVWDLLIHDLDLALRISGGEAFEVAGATPAPEHMQDEVDCLLVGPDQLRASLSASRLDQRKIRSWNIRCDEVSIELDLVRQNVTTYRHRSHAVGPGLAYRSETSIDIPYVRHGGEPLELQFRHFLRLIDGAVDADIERNSLMPAHQLAALVANGLRGDSSMRKAARVDANTPS